MANCTNCGAVLKEGALFCDNCGTKIQPTNYQQNYQQTPPSYDQTPAQPVYQQTIYTQPQADRTVSVGDWFVTVLLMCIPIVNIVLLCVWAFGSDTNPSKSNWAKAQLIWMLIGVVLAIIFSILGVGLFAAIANSF